MGGADLFRVTHLVYRQTESKLHGSPITLLSEASPGNSYNTENAGPSPKRCCVLLAIATVTSMQSACEYTLHVGT